MWSLREGQCPSPTITGHCEERSDVAIPHGYATRLLLEEKLAFARYEQMTDVVSAAQQPFRFNCRNATPPHPTSLESLYDCPRQSSIFMIRCAEHHARPPSLCGAADCASLTSRRRLWRRVKDVARDDHRSLREGQCPSPTKKIPIPAE